MSRPVTSDVDPLAHGRAVSKEAFLALLADPAAQEDLARIAQAHDLLQPPGSDEDAPAALPISWDDLAAYAEGTLADPHRRHAVERFLGRQAPELLHPAEETPTTVELRGGETETWVERLPQPKTEPGGGEGSAK
jgi:hypothetical protein